MHFSDNNNANCDKYAHWIAISIIIFHDQGDEVKVKE
jgi:hypothetical protein